MRYSLNWLAELVDLPFSGEELASRLPSLGFEVSGLERLGPAFTNVVVGEILSIAKHPQADRLSLCEVTNGSERLTIVCGANNIAVGQRVPVARVGARLPGGRKIERAKIRGVESQGMICSAPELGLPSEADGILVLEPSAPLGQSAASLLAPSDAALDLEVTPNRPDVLSHFGLARELALAHGLRLKDPVAPLACAEEGETLSVEILDPEACPRYIGRTLRGLQVGPSPAWLAQRLASCGLRPINNVVDVTNYVLLELGHPLHAFDQDRLEGGIRVRRASHGELFRALDGREYALDGADLVIADGRRAVALAGVIGGSETAVGEATRDVFLEAAYFRPAGIRRTARRLRIRTESSYRFERGTDPEGPARSSARAAALLLQTCAGRGTLSKQIDVYPKPLRPAPIQVDHRAVEETLGLELPRERAGELLGALASQGGKLEAAPSLWNLTPPSHRVDLLHFVDVAEEVARLVGYDAIPSRAAPVPPSLEEAPPLVSWTERLRDRLAGLGFAEAYNYDFLSARELLITDRVGSDEAELERTLPRLENPVSADWVYLRPSLIHGLLRSLSRNVNRGAETVLLFEAGRLYSERGERAALGGLMSGRLPAGVHWRARGQAVDFFALKGVLEALFRGDCELEFESLSLPWLHPRLSAELRVGGAPVGILGQVHPATAARWEVPEAWYFELDLERLPSPPAWAKAARPFTSFPLSRRDLSVLLPEECPWAEVVGLAGPAGGAELVSLELVDVYTGAGIPKGRKSLTLRLTLGAMDRTLSEAEIQSAVGSVLRALEHALGAELRS